MAPAHIYGSLLFVLLHVLTQSPSTEPYGRSERCRHKQGEGTRGRGHLVCIHKTKIHSNGERRGKTLGGIRKSYSQQHSTKRRRWSKEAHHRMRNSTAPSYMRNSTGGTVEGARSEGKVEWPFKKETQNGLLTCSQCADHQWMLPPVPGCGPCRYHCNVTKTGAKNRAASWDSIFSSTPSPS